MNQNTDFDRIAQSWLQDGPTEMPDRSLQAALDEVHVTSQQHFGAARRANPMNGNTWRVAAAAVIGLLIILGGITFLGGRQGSVGGPPAASPTPTASATPTPAVLTEGEPVALIPGRYAFASHGPNPTDLVYGAIRLGRKRNPRRQGLWRLARSRRFSNRPLTTVSRTPAPTTRPSCRPWNRSRRAPRCHRRSAGHRAGPDHGRERGRLRREGRGLHRGPQTRHLRERAGRLRIWVLVPGARDGRSEDSTGDRRFGVSQNDRERALRDRGRRQDLHVPDEPAG